MAESVCCSFATGQVCDFAANIVGLVANVAFIILELSWPYYSGPSLTALITGHSAWAASAALMILAICTWRQFFACLGIVVQLVALVAFSYFVVLNPYIYLTIILMILILWWMLAILSVVITKWCHPDDIVRI